MNECKSVLELVESLNKANDGEFSDLVEVLKKDKEVTAEAEKSWKEKGYYEGIGGRLGYIFGFVDAKRLDVPKS